MTLSPIAQRRLKPRTLILLGLVFLIFLTAIAGGARKARADWVCKPKGGGDLLSAPADLIFVCKEVEDDGPDCGKNPYLWNPIGMHYQRKFAEACYFVTWDENEKLYDELWLDQTPLGP